MKILHLYQKSLQILISRIHTRIHTRIHNYFNNWWKLKLISNFNIDSIQILKHFFILQYSRELSTMIIMPIFFREKKILNKF